MTEPDPETMTTPWRRDPGETGPALGRWAAARISPEATISDSNASSAGTLSESAFARRCGR